MAAFNNYRLSNPVSVRLTSWGVAASLAFMLAVLSTLSSTGSRRVGLAYAALTGNAADSKAANPQFTSLVPEAEAEKRRLNDALRLLAADRDRLLMRVTSLERNVDDITGSISRKETAPPQPQISAGHAAPAEAPEPAPAVTAPVTTPLPAAPLSRAQVPAPSWITQGPEPWPSPTAAMDIPAVAPPAPAQPQTQTQTRIAAVAPSSESATAAATASRTQFGVDIGTASDVNEAKAVWGAARAQHPRLLAGLRPVLLSREGASQMRVIIGPLPNAAAAAKLCVTLAAADVMCSTRPFEGQQLAVQ